MKKIILLLLALTMLFTLGVAAENADTEKITNVVRLLEIMHGDENGNLNLGDKVTRAEFVKMAICASTHKSSAETAPKSSLFPDVRSDHWATRYISVAISNGWINGYLDGTFRPDNNVKLEEAVNIVLKVLGYTEKDLAGAYPEPQMANYTSLGLDTYITTSRGEYLTREDCKSIVAFGDSITAQPWPDCFARRLTELGIDNRAIIRRGIGGNRVLRDYKFRIKKHWGEAGIKRFEHTLDTAVGADAVIVLHGINDIIHPGVNNPICPMSELPTPEELIEGYRTYIAIAHKLGLKIYLATLLPCPRCLNDGGYREEIRLAANEWIRTTDEHDGVIDFEAAVRREDDPQQMILEYDSGDHLHPSLAGAKKMAWSIPEEYFKN